MAFIALSNKFTPYTFDELVKPFAMYDTAYQQERTRTDDLLEKAALLEDLSPTVDKEAYDAYQEWKGQLKAASDQLATQGLDNNTRRTITSLGDAYRTDYLPIVAKLKTRGELIRGQREYLQKHPNAFFDVNYSTTPVTDVTGSSTYNAYDPDDIFKRVAEYSYSRLASGQPDLSSEEYLSQFGDGIADETQRGRVAQAIESGKALAAANHKQKEFENYMTKVRTMRTGSGGGSSYTTPNDINIVRPDGGTLQVKYNKKTKEYQYTDAAGQLRTLSEDKINETDDIIADYYGGYYNKIDVNGNKIKRVLSDDGYKIKVGKEWKTLNRGGNTTYRELLGEFGMKVMAPLDAELTEMNNASLTGRNLERGKRKGTIVIDEVHPDRFADYEEGAVISPTLKSLVLKLEGLIQAGVVDPDDENFAIKIYKDDQERILGYQGPTEIVNKAKEKLNAPIEKGWMDTKRGLDAIKENKGKMD